MVVVVVVMITTILATAITGYIVSGISDQFIEFIPRSENPITNATYTRLDNLIVEAQFSWVIMLSGIIGLLIWGLLQAQSRETVTGRY